MSLKIFFLSAALAVCVFHMFLQCEGKYSGKGAEVKPETKNESPAVAQENEKSLSELPYAGLKDEENSSFSAGTDLCRNVLNSSSSNESRAENSSTSCDVENNVHQKEQQKYSSTGPLVNILTKEIVLVFIVLQALLQEGIVKEFSIPELFGKSPFAAKVPPLLYYALILVNVIRLASSEALDIVEMFLFFQGPFLIIFCIILVDFRPPGRSECPDRHDGNFHFCPYDGDVKKEDSRSKPKYVMVILSVIVYLIIIRLISTYVSDRNKRAFSWLIATVSFTPVIPVLMFICFLYREFKRRSLLPPHLCRKRKIVSY